MRLQLSNYVIINQTSHFQPCLWKEIRSSRISDAVFDTINQGFYFDISRKVMIPLHRKITTAIDLFLHD